MEKQVIITIQSQQDSGSDSDTIELITEGTIAERNGSLIISYCESEATGMPGVLTDVTVSHDKLVTITRKGEVNSQLIFEEGARHMCHYDMGFGDLFICVGSAQIENAMGENGGDLSIDYLIEINNAVASQNRFHINVKEAVSSYAQSN